MYLVCCSQGSQKVRHDWVTERTEALKWVGCLSMVHALNTLLLDDFLVHYFLHGLPRWCSGKDPGCQCRRCRRCGFDLWVGKIPWRKKRQPAPINEYKLEEKYHFENRKVCTTQPVFENFRTCKIKNRQEKEAGGGGGAVVNEEGGMEHRKGWYSKQSSEMQVRRFFYIIKNTLHPKDRRVWKQ